MLVEMLLLGGIAAAERPPVLTTKRSVSGERITMCRTNRPWWQALQRAVMDIERSGAGGYSTTEEAKRALVDSFTWNDRLKRPLFDVQNARPSFCSGAVYSAVLSGLLRWEEMNRRRVISEDAWKALLPQMVADGVGPWGYANANGPGFALLVHRLGAGVNFTDWRLARPADVMKIWWTKEIGGRERGHLVILVKDMGEEVQVWSSHVARDGHPAGYGVRTIAKSSIKRVLFSRITNPSAFGKAHQLPDEPWLTRQLTEPVSWEDCCRRCGVRTSAQ